MISQLSITSGPSTNGGCSKCVELASELQGWKRKYEQLLVYCKQRQFDIGPGLTNESSVIVRRYDPLRRIVTVPNPEPVIIIQPKLGAMPTRIPCTHCNAHIPENVFERHMEVVHGEIFDGSQGMSDNGPGSLATVESETASEIASEVESEPAMLIELTYDAKSSKSEDEIGEVVILIDSSDDASNDAYIDNANAEEVITGTNGYDDTEQAKYSCPACTARFASEKRLNEHKMHKHPHLLRRKRSRSVICSICSETFSPTDHLCHTCEGLQLRCEYCPMEFRTTSTLRSHLHTDHTLSELGSYECDLCLRRYQMLSFLRVHRKTHMKRTFICQDCGVEFENRYDLKLHTNKQHSSSGIKKLKLKSYAVNNEESPLKPIGEADDKIEYSCRFCNETFDESSALRKHLVIKHAKNGRTRSRKYTAPKRKCLQRIDDTISLQTS